MSNIKLGRGRLYFQAPLGEAPEPRPSLAGTTHTNGQVYDDEGRLYWPVNAARVEVESASDFPETGQPRALVENTMQASAVDFYRAALFGGDPFPVKEGFTIEPPGEERRFFPISRDDFSDHPGTVTGRFAGTQPEAQPWPPKSLPADGGKFTANIDFSAIEERVAAFYGLSEEAYGLFRDDERIVDHYNRTDVMLADEMHRRFQVVENPDGPPVNRAQRRARDAKRRRAHGWRKY